MKKYPFLIFLTMLLLTSCIFHTGGKSKEPSGNTSDDTKTDKTVSSVVLHNDSIFTTKIFKDSLREIEICTLKAGESKTVSPDSVSAKGEVVYYVTYYVDVGIEVPWYSNESFIIAVPKNNETVTSKILTPSSMSTNNCYILLENNSSKNIAFKQGSAELAPDSDKSTTIIMPGKKGAYEIKSSYFANFPSFKISTTDGEAFNLPSQMGSFEQGKIYSITITNGNGNLLDVSLKTVTPFDPDVSKQIWSFSDNSFNPAYPCILRNSYNNDGTNLIMGTMATDTKSIGYKIIDKYNSESKLYSFTINQNQEDPIISCSILDFVQIDDGSIVMLLEITYKDKTDNSKYKSQFIYSLDFEMKELKNWSYEFPESMIFRADSKNKFIYTKDGKLAIAGAVRRDSQMHKYFAVLDISNQTPSGNSYIFADSTNWKEKTETMFTSIWYDDTNFFVCGYDNWNTEYSELSHKGIIYKFNPLDLSDNHEVYSCDRVLFFCIDGSDNNWYACGEYADNGKILKGCYISKNMADENKDPVKYATYTTNRSYCYFTQLCCYQNKIIIAGKASDSFDESENPLPIIVAFDKASDEILWENTNFTNYNNINAIIPNQIGTYVVQLQSDSHLHYVSADLLGNENR